MPPLPSFGQRCFMSYKWLVSIPLLMLFVVGGGGDNSAKANPILICAAKVGVQFIATYLLPKLMDEYVFKSNTPDIERVQRELAYEIKKLQSSNTEMKTEIQEEFGIIERW